MTINNHKQKATGHVTNGHFTGSDSPFVCEIPIASSNNKNKKYIILLTLNWLCGCPQALLQRRNVSSVCTGLANGTKRTPSQKDWGNLLLQLHIPHRQHLTGISNAFFASFTSIWPSFPRFYCNANKAYLLCLTECTPLDFRRSSILSSKQNKSHCYVQTPSTGVRHK